MDKERFGIYLRKLRTDRNLTLTGLANLIGITPYYISHMESGNKTNPDIKIIYNMFKAMKLNKEEIEQFLDLHAKANGCVSYDIVQYIMQNDEVRAAIRLERDKADTVPNLDDFMTALTSEKDKRE